MSQESWKCVDCKLSFNNYMALKKHESRNKSAIESGNPSCIQKLQRKRQKRELDNMSKDEILNSIDSSKQHSELMSKINDLIEYNKKAREDINRLSKEHLELITKHDTLVKQIKKQDVSIAKPVMTQPRRLQIAARQEWKCNKCTKLFSSVFEVDHIIRWKDSYDDSNENLQALCVECHKLKTAEENIK